jgi:tetratricopeptide (TPR) repeat protein
MICAGVYSDLSYFAGVPLSTIMEELKGFRALCLQYGQQLVLMWVEQNMQLCLNFMGQSVDPLVLTGEVMDEAEVVRIMETRSPINLVGLLMVKLTLAIYMNNIPVAIEVWRRLESLHHKKSVLRFYYALQLFFEGFIAAILSTSSKASRRRAKNRLARLKVFAKHSPNNYLHKVHLIEAELASSAGRHDDAMKKFISAIELAKNERFVNEQALACERAFYALRRWGRPDDAVPYLNQALSLYEEWGAQVKVDQLRICYPSTIENS